ncbi:reverse transcriptase domain-containing protein [Tanacetum coccineum]|uniref:Reverse transcriptase domain-containing protein n=1 Tax=Tanacetum coccineum TaxID=301880 RepID=A0ABQ5AVG0_9ASTR
MAKTPSNTSIVNLFQSPGVSRDQVMLMEFPFTLKGKARLWVNRLSAGSITTWDLLKNAFLSRYRPLSKIIRQTKAIRNFGQECNEPLHLAWERFNDLLYYYPDHKINEHEQLQIFYQGLDPRTIKKADFIGPIPRMTPADRIKAINELLKHSLSWYKEEEYKENDFDKVLKHINDFEHNTSVLNEEVRMVQHQYKTLNDERDTLLEETISSFIKEAHWRQKKIESFVWRIKRNYDMTFKNQASAIKTIKKTSTELLNQYTGGGIKEILPQNHDNSIEPILDHLPEDCNNPDLLAANSIDEEIPTPKLKELPSHLEYAFLDNNHKLPVIISLLLSEQEKRVCIDYRKLNDATRKDHFPLPFIDQMLERLSGNEYNCFLDGFLGYFQIPLAPEDQEKTTFTCPYGTFACRRMPFGLCNAPATFQRCMTAIFHDMCKDFMEVFMDDFSVFGYSFRTCLNNLSKMLARCEETNLVLNWEKCQFMVKEGIVLGHKISKVGIEVDKAKVDVIASLPYPTNVKGIRSFLGHVGFYKRFINSYKNIVVFSRGGKGSHEVNLLDVKDFTNKNVG